MSRKKQVQEEIVEEVEAELEGEEVNESVEDVVLETECHCDTSTKANGFCPHGN